MSKFLQLVESSDPTKANDPKWELVEFLKSKGISVSLNPHTDMVDIDTGGRKIALSVQQTEEDSQTTVKTGGMYDVDRNVSELAATANDGVKGVAARMLGTAPQQAKQAVKQRANVTKQAIPVYQKGTKDLEAALRLARQQSSANII